LIISHEFKDVIVDFESLSEPEERPSVPAPKYRPLYALRLIIFQPDQAFASIISQKQKSGWLAPVILILGLAVLAALIASQATTRTTITSNAFTTRSTQSGTQQSRANTNSGGRQGQTQQGGSGAIPVGPGGELPPGAGFIPGDAGGGPAGQIPGAAAPTTQTGTASSATAQTASPWVTASLPAASFLITWLLLGVLTNLFSLAFGGRSGAGMALTIAAWASIPLAVRNLMQIMYYLATGAAIQAPGLSGFAPTPGSDNWLILLQQILSRLDIYFIWEIGLLAIGMGVWGGLVKKKSIPAAVLAVVIVLLLQSLIALGLQMLGNVNLNTNTLLRLR
jgi:hypothetical protein